MHEAAIAPNWESLLGRRLAEQFRPESLLKQRAGMAVYRATDLESGMAVKLKLAHGAKATRALHREAAATTGLDHPRVPSPLAAFEEEGVVGLVLTYFEGPSLRERLDQTGPIDEAELAMILRSALECLAYLQARTPPILHRDVKPGNMIALAGGEVALIDFGIAADADRDRAELPVHQLTQAHTVGYAPPEQVIGLASYPATDVYALAASCLYLATGVHPVRHWHAGSGRMRAPAGFEPRLAALLGWMLEPGLDARCPDAATALAAVLAL